MRRQLLGKSVITNYGNKKTYIIHDVRFENGPCNTFFECNGQNVSVAKYFYKQYNLKISDKRQAMLVIKAAGRLCHIPSEFCMIDGVPDSIRSNPKAMKDLLAKVRQTPDQKVQAIASMIRKLIKNSSKLSEFDIEIDATPQSLESRKLAAPELIHKEGDDQQLFVSERLLKQMPVFSCEGFKDFELLFIYDRYSRNEASEAMENFEKCQRSIGMNSGKFKSIQMEDFRGNFNKLVEWLDYELSAIKKQTHKQLFAVLVLDRKTDYSKYKNLFTKQNVMTQVVLKQTCRRMNLSIASNIMKQINSKIGGESIRIKFPEFMHKEKVMVIGIDVCHAGKKSVVGFVATTNPSCTSAYSDIIIQPKGQELVKKELDKCIMNAIACFKGRNGGQLPTKIIVYRDGVGEGMRQEIIDKEVQQFKEVIKPLYNSVSGPPAITLVVVNKRINQRMFIQSRDGRSVENPPPGSIIDSNLVENQRGN